jgi:hypothetical protein
MPSSHSQHRQGQRRILTEPHRKFCTGSHGSGAGNFGGSRSDKEPIMADYTPYPYRHYLHANSVDQVLINIELMKAPHPNAPHDVYVWDKPDPLIIDMCQRIATLQNMSESFLKNFENIVEIFDNTL